MAIDAPVRPCTIVLHDDDTSPEDVLCGADVLPLGDIAVLSAPGAKSLCIQSTKLASYASDVSIHVSVARLFGFENRMRASVEIVDDADIVTATHVELLFRDQQLSRADMWKIRAQIDSSVVYETQKLQYLGSVTATIEAIYRSGQRVQSAFVSHPQTKLIFRGASARFTILIQVSKEMLEDWYGCDLMYERMLNGFLPELFHRWDALKVRHQVSVVLFGRVLQGSKQLPAHRDFFQVLALDVPCNTWRGLLRKLREAFNNAQLPSEVSLAADGNMLEAIHVAALDFNQRDTEQRLTSTGTSVVAITAGAGLFNTDYEKLKKTTELLVGTNIGIDIVSVSRQPLHPVPLFRYVRSGTVEYALPHWIDISYWSSPHDQQESRWLMPDASSEFCNVKIGRLPMRDPSISIEEYTAAYDDATFALSTTTPLSKREVKDSDSVKKDRANKNINEETSRTDGLTATKTVDQSDAGRAIAMSKPRSIPAPSIPAPSDVGLKAAPKPIKPSRTPHPLMQTGRNISIGPRGLAPSQATASTVLSAQYAQHERDVIPTASFAANSITSGLAKQIKESLRKKPSYQSLHSQSTVETAQLSQAVDIPVTDRASTETPRDPASLVEEAIMENAGPPAGESFDSTNSPSKRQQDVEEVQSTQTLHDEASSISPWLTLLNPCYPRKDNMRIASEYRQWQNIFTSTVSSAVFKWSSICSPAALPLMTDYRPSLADLDSLAGKKVRRLLITSIAEASSIRQVVAQMIYMRLNAGFQVVPSRRRPKDQMGLEHIERILLSLGERYHEICQLSEAEIQVTEYERRPQEQESSAIAEVSDDTANSKVEIMSIISRKGKAAQLNWYQLSDSLDWSEEDDRCVNMTGPAYDGECRMRLVLIPVEPFRTDAKTPSGTRELSDDEHRLEGIQKLTQMWQRHRYFTDEDQKHQTSMIKAKALDTMQRDPNPLAIEYQTRDTSAVVGALGLKPGDAEMPTRLFSESEQFHTSNFDVTKLARQMQEPPPNGVEFRDRRWFTRLHLKCFRGDEMVNWLLRVFKDLETRDDAVALGNQLMGHDIFSHVRGSHEFRDGNYFYQIRAAHRTTDYPDTAGFFGRPVGRSVPSTPAGDPRMSPAPRPVQPDTDLSRKVTPTPTLGPVDSREKRVVMLSQKLQYNVDSGRKSSQLEIVNVHYDRIHNPENCYHVHLDWTNTTAKLIRDAINRWANLIESHGLKLVQLPIEEASKVNNQHILEQPLNVKLVIHPPTKNPTTPQLEPHPSASPRAVREDRHAFHKAVLRKANFVLDLESASSFRRSVDISYSWGRPDYERTQFIHKSGLLLAQVVNDGKRDFTLLPNRLAAAVSAAGHSSGSGGARKGAETASVEEIVQRFTAFCRDEKALMGVAEEMASKSRAAVASPFVHASPGAGGKADQDVPPMELPPQLTHRTWLKNVG